MRSRRLWAVVPPQSPDQSAEVRLLSALVEAIQGVLDHDPHANPFVHELYETGIFKTAIKREEARLAGQFSPAERLAALVAPVNAEGLTVNPVELLLGWWEGVERGQHGIREFGFHAGLAGLTEQEARAWHLKARGFDEAGIARFMDGATRRTRQFGVSIGTVEVHLRNGLRKLEALRDQVVSA